jgi:hypothetical protein
MNSRTSLETWEDNQTKRRRALPKDGVASVTKLEAARNALAIVSELPDIVGLIDNAEAIRAAAVAKHVSTQGINCWTRFVVYLIDHRANERAAEWSALSKLTENQLDTLESVANEEDRLLTRGELIKLGKAGESSPPPKAKAQSAKTIEAIEMARAIAIEIAEETKRKHKLQLTVTPRSRTRIAAHGLKLGSGSMIRWRAAILMMTSRAFQRGKRWRWRR